MGLSDKKKGSGGGYIPYRDSKLTSLLKQSIGGNAYCLMIACVTPSDYFYEENVSTLNYATRASYIANAPKKNVDPRVREIQDLKKKNQLLQLELRNANKHIEYLTQLIPEEQVKQFGINYLDGGQAIQGEEGKDEDMSSPDM